MMVDKSGFHIDFKTTHPDGLIFFMMNEEGKKDFVALFINNHKLVYSFNCGSGSGPSYLETSWSLTAIGTQWSSAGSARMANCCLTQSRSRFLTTLSTLE